MSLTSFIQEKDVRKAFAEMFPRPPIALKKKKLLALPLTKHHSFIGTAFDYLARFQLERTNRRRRVASSWVAYSALHMLRIARFLCKREEIDRLYQIVGEIIFAAEKERILFVRSGRLTTGVIRACINLASVDAIRRGKSLYDLLGGYAKVKLRILQISRMPTGKVPQQTKLMMKELRALAGVFRREQKRFRAKHTCVLNPGFGEASGLVGGADADLLIDDMLIEIKATKDLKLTRPYLNQVIGYYILCRIGGVNGVRRKQPIRRLGIYFARHGELLTIPVSDVVPRRGMPAFIEWFKKRAKRSFG